MRYSLTIVYTTSRKQPHLSWFYSSLLRKINPGEHIAVSVIDYYADADSWMAVDDGVNFLPYEDQITVQRWRCKPTIWQGKYQLPKEPYWAKSAYLNTGICRCKTDWLCFVDDRSYLDSHFLQSIREAMDAEYAVCGSYEKRAGMKIEDGEIVESGTLLGVDTRTPGCYLFDSWYGGSGALPLEWCLAVNGFNESLCDGLGSEDSVFGVTLRNSGYPIRYDSKMRLIEDRTPGELDGALKRSDHGISPNDASHKIVEMMRDKTTSQNNFDIRNMRDRVLSGEPFPPPTDSPIHWFTGTPITDFR